MGMLLSVYDVDAVSCIHIRQSDEREYVILLENGRVSGGEGGEAAGSTLSLADYLNWDDLPNIHLPAADNAKYTKNFTLFHVFHAAFIHMNRQF